jgi:hypothetical protein
MKKIKSLRNAIRIVWHNAENIKLSKGYYFQSGFFDVDGQTYYITTGDTRLPYGVMYRTARDRKDYTGGVNQWDFESLLSNKGYKLEYTN